MTKPPNRVTPSPHLRPEWHSRGYLPHRDAVGLVQTVNLRLFDALPAEVLERFKTMPSPRGQADWRARAEAYLDAGHGACYLCRPRIAQMVQDALLFFDALRYRLIEWSIRPNHVHTLLEVLPPCTLTDVLHSWKSYTSHEANRLLRRSGMFWQIEYWDRYIRDERHLANVIRYIREKNPSPYSSAAYRAVHGIQDPCAALLGSAGPGSAGVSPALAVEEAKGNSDDGGKKGRRDACAPRTTPSPSSPPHPTKPTPSRPPPHKSPPGRGLSSRRT